MESVEKGERGEGECRGERLRQYLCLLVDTGGACVKMNNNRTNVVCMSYS